jgi:serine/threonine-protein phosphatase 2A regulatory subunit B
MFFPGHGETSWCFSQVKGALNDDITDADVISCVEFNHDGDLLATGDKGGRVVIFQVRNYSYVKLRMRNNQTSFFLS